MKFKKLMLITFLLLAILTIGAVSASDDVASDNLAVSDDDGEVIDVSSDNELGEMDEDDVDISVDDIDKNEEDYQTYNFTEVSVTENEGNFVICTGKGQNTVEVYKQNLADGDRCIWDDDEESFFLGVSLKDINDYIASNIDSDKNFYDIFENSDRCFRFVLEYKGNDLVVDSYNVDVTDDEITFSPAENVGEPNIEVNVDEDFDVSDPDATVIEITSDEVLRGTFWVEVDDGDDRGHKLYSYDIADSDELNITVSNLKIKNTEHYVFWVYYCPEGDTIDWDDETGNKDDFLIEDEIHAEGRNYSTFWWDVPHNVNYFSTEPIITFYCAGRTEGTVVVRVYRYDDDNDVLVVTYSKNIADNDEGFLYWDSHDLGFEVGNGYGINITCGDFSEVAECFFNNPIEFNEISYLESEDKERVRIVTVEIPSDMGGSISLSINGALFELNTDMFDELDETTELGELYWEYPWYNDEVMVYTINNLNIGYEFGEGIYNITVGLEINDDGISVPFICQGNVKVVKPKTEEKDGIFIKFYDQQTYSVYDDEYYIAEIIAPEGADGTVIVTVSGQDDPIFECKLSEFKDGYVVCPSDLKLKAGNYEMTVAYWEDDTQILNSTSLISLDYGEDGIMRSDVPFVMKPGEDKFKLYFATKDVEGEVYIIIDGIEYYRSHISADSLDFDYREGYPVLYVSFDDFDRDIGYGEYEKVQIFYEGADGIRDVDTHNGLEIAASTPSIFIPDWPISIRDDDVILIYPNGDESENVRIVLKIEGEVWLNATIEELGLRLKTDDEERQYYGIPADMLNKTLEIGEIYYNVIAYYYSDNFNTTSFDEESNDRLIVEGMLDEVDCTYDGPVLAVFYEDDDGEITISIQGREDDPIVIDAFKNHFYTWTLIDLGLSEGFCGQIDVEYGDDNGFGGNLWVVNNEKFRVKTKDTLIFFEDDVVLSVFSPQGSAGKTIRLYSAEDNEFICEYLIKDDDQGVYLDFTLHDLNITEAGWYEINVNVNDEQIGEESYGFNVASAMEFNGNGIATLSEDGNVSSSMEVVGLNLPFDFEGNVTITLDGVEVFNKNLNDISSDDYGDFMHYTIFTSDLANITEGRQRMIVTFNDIKDERSVTFAKRNVNASGNITLEMFSVSCDKNDWQRYFASIEVPMDADFDINNDVKVLINNTVYDLDIWDEDNWEDDTKIYYLAHKPDSLDKTGKLPVTVICYKNSVEVVRNTDILTLFNSPEIFVMWSNPDDNKVEYDIGSDSAIHFYPNGDESNFRIIVMIGGKVYLNATRDELALEPQDNDQNEKFYYVGPANFKKAIAPGHYENVVAIYSNEYVDIYNTDGTMPTYIDITGDPLEPDFNITIPNVEEGNPISVIVTASEAFTGDVIVKVGEKDILVHIEDGRGVNYTTGVILPAGNNYVANLTYLETVSFKAAVSQTTFNVTAKKSDDKGKTTPGGDGSDSSKDTTQQAKKAATKIIAKKKTFKAKKKVKKYTITLKSSKKFVKKAKVTLKVGKKIYKAKTNKKGKATFKITKLTKKGKYKAIIKFAGSKLYKASKKTVKITVK